MINKQCVATSGERCAKSVACSRYAACGFNADLGCCVAPSQEACETSVGCKEESRCNFTKALICEDISDLACGGDELTLNRCWLYIKGVD